MTTFREKLITEHPEEVNPDAIGGVNGCPFHYGYEKAIPPICKESISFSDEGCSECWDREMPGAEKEGPVRGPVVYVSGPITGVEKYWQPFEHAADNLIAIGCTPLVPTFLPKGLTNAQYMRIDMAMLDVADAVLFLPGWAASKGCVTEWNYIQYINKPRAFNMEQLKEVLGYGK